MTSFRAIRDEAAEVQSRREFNRAHLAGLTAWDRHKLYVRQFQEHYGSAGGGAAARPPTRTDADVLRDQHRFIRDAASDAASASWEIRLACKYYAKLVKEYAICDLSAYRDSRVGLRWRTEREVVCGKGQFECGARGCSSQRGLATFELPFSYREAGEAKQALVKVRVCEDCAAKLNYRKEKKLQKLERALQKHAGKRGRSSPVPAEADAQKKGRRDGDGAGVDGEAAVRTDADLDTGAQAGAEQDVGTARRPGDAVGPAAGAAELAAAPAGGGSMAAGEFWKQKDSRLEASIEDEFDAYLADMFM